MSKLRVAVLFGGRSGEHEVSIVSAESVMKAMNREKYEVIPVGITREGRWIAGDDAAERLKADEPIQEAESIILSTDPGVKALITLGQAREKRLIDVVFPVLHGPFGEDGSVQGLLELAGIPYVGAGVLGSACGMDKVVMKALFRQAGLSVVKDVWFLAVDWVEKKGEYLEKIESNLGYPIFIKPANLGSSVGVSKAKTREECLAGIEEALRYDRKILVEKAVEAPREIECAVLGNERPEASVLGEIFASGEFYDYNAKYVDGKSKTVAPAELEPELSSEIRNRAIDAFKAVDCQGMGRVDFLIEGGGTSFYVNEINTIPGFTSISMYPRLWEKSGLSYPDLIDRLIDLALARGAEKKKLATSYQPKEEWHRR